MGALDGSGKGADGRTYSIELCGGTHVRQTGDIGVFAILGDTASSAGVRRIEALTGAAAFDYLSDRTARLGQVASDLKTRPEDVPARVKVPDGRAPRPCQRGCAAAPRSGDGRWCGQGDAAAPREVGGVRFLSQVLSGVQGATCRRSSTR